MLYWWIVKLEDAARLYGGAAESSRSVNVQLSDAWKEGIAHLVRRPPFDRLMAWGVRMAVPRQRVGVALVTFNADEEVLLLRHVFHTANPWGLPGGWLARDEAPADGLIRELREELGVGVALDAPILVAHDQSPPHIILAYLGWLRSGPLRLNAEIIEARWFGPDRLPRLPRPFAEQAITAGLSLLRVQARPGMADLSLIEANRPT